METDIMVTVNCSDKSIEIKLKKLLQYEYFKSMLTFGSTKMVAEKDIISDGNLQSTTYSFKIPHIKVDCSSDIFLSLLQPRMDIYSFGNAEKILEMMLYIDMYQMSTTIHFRHGFAVNDHFYFVEYVKNQLPLLNPFEIIKKGKFNFYGSFIDYGFELCSKNELNNDLVKDLFEYLDEYTTKKYNCYWCPYVQINVIKSIKVFEKLLPEETKSLVTTDRIAAMINRYMIECRGYCTGSYVNIYMQQYNRDIDAIFAEFAILHDLGLINAEKLGSAEKYKIYK